MSMSANLLRAVSAAVDGYRTGGEVFVVASEDDLDTIGVFDTRADAEAYRDSEGGEVFGPYETEGVEGDPKLPRKVRLTFEDGSEVEHTCDEVEAVFLTVGAIDRFVIPYYARLRGASYASQLREDFLSGSRQLCCKGPISVFREVWPNDDEPLTESALE